jgi:2-C-methyl-D-erythritol 4-phosphate cytidylyltransferase/2-C-methyl-D-erythritol 2,4-cyclodiphosphate synthase
MPTPTFSVVVVTAAPPGQDAGGAYMKIDGRESLLKAVELFLNRENVKHVQIVFPNDQLEEAKRKYGGHLMFAGVKVTGSNGAKWTDQLAAASEKIADDATHVIVHDAARPAVPAMDVDALMEAAADHSAVALVAPVRNALVEVDPGGNPVGYRAPAEFVQLLTPQAFAKEKFLQFAKSKQEPHASELFLLKASPLNVRVTSPDAGTVNALIKILPKPKVKPPSSPFEEAQW